ncbi:MAG: hypothetical protein JWN10_2797 [Solirubrobacterales bacterium]|nr:hypothetical protein [Solirubrobacterales bacterium]
MTLTERESAILIADSQKDLIALVRMDYIAGLDFDDEQMIGLATVVLAVQDALAHPDWGLAEVDAGLHLLVSLFR